jgi:hypothetical protein
MELTNLEEKARESKLSYDDTDSLLRFLNFQRKRAGETPIHEDYGPGLCELLSRNFPGVTFEYADHRIIASVERGVSGSLVERISFVSSRIPHLMTTMDFGSDEFNVVFRADGIGITKEDTHYDFFEHCLDLEEIRRDCKNNEDAIDEYLRNYFSEHICLQMDDPFFNPDGEGCELYFETGSRDELERLLKLFILTEPDIEGHEDEEVRLYAATYGVGPYLGSSDCYHSERLGGLMAIALSENRPVGWSYEYNDGAYNRKSGYDEYPASLTWDIDGLLEQSSAREKMAARRELRKWLDARGHDMAWFDALSKREGIA